MAHKAAMVDLEKEVSGCFIEKLFFIRSILYVMHAPFDWYLTLVL